MASPPESAPPSRPPPASASRDLDDAEFAELGRLLADIPEPLSPLGLDEADGYATAIAVQSAPVDADAWQRRVFDADGHRWGAAEPSAEKARAAGLLARREAAIRASLAEFGAFEPWLAAPDDGADPIAGTVAPWIYGFLAGLDGFPPEEADDAAMARLDRLERYLAEPIVDRPASVDAAVDEIVRCVFALYEVAEARRYRVTTARRDPARVGRNEPCPCGSGRKFKHCHGAA